MEAESKCFTLANYDTEGELINVSEVAIGELQPAMIASFEKKIARLSGDLELPLEGELPGKIPQIDFRIGSDLNGAYVLYYLHDEVVFAALCLRGQDVESETELTQVFKFLLLDTQDLDEPTEEEIEEVLASKAFQFSSIEDRPVTFTVCFTNPPDEDETFGHIREMNCHLAAAFLFSENGRHSQQ